MKWKLAPRWVSSLIVLASFLGILLARREGFLQFLEIRAYDHFLRETPVLPNGDPIVLIEITEADIQSPHLDYPLTDNTLGELLEKIALERAAVIGLDIWRDLPVPKSGEQLTNLNKVLLERTNIVAIYTATGDIRPPPVLEPFPDRLAFNDNFPPDEHVEKATPKVRRSILFVKAEPPAAEDGAVPDFAPIRLDSFPFRVACLYLQRKGVELQSIPTNHVDFAFGDGRLHRLLPYDGPYVDADTKGTQLLLDFKRPAEFTRYSVSEVLSGKIPPGSLRDKIVLLGINASSVFDERVTPVRFNHLGIEVQSLTILQLLRCALEGEKGLIYPAEWQEDVWTLAWCVLGGVIGFQVRSTFRFIAAILSSLFLLALVAQKSFALGCWIPIVAPAAAFLPAAALVTSYMSFHEYRDRHKLMRLFSNQVSPDIAQALWAQRDEFLAGERPKSQQLTATVLFTDLKGFSSTSEGMDPSELMDWLNEYMEVMADEVMAHDGVVEKYIGDSVMAVFGVPVPRTTPGQIAEDARNSVRCALAMGEKMRELNIRWKARGLPLCSMRIGIHTGPLVAGSLGSKDRQEYTVIGDSVNTASRLESFEKDATDPILKDDNCRVLISSSTQLYLGSEFSLVPVGAISLKGKSEKVTVYRVLEKSKELTT